MTVGMHMTQLSLILKVVVKDINSAMSAKVVLGTVAILQVPERGHAANSSSGSYPSFSTLIIVFALKRQTESQHYKKTLQDITAVDLFQIEHLNCLS